MMEKKEDAVLYFADSFNCAQAVFTPFGKECGLTEDQCLKTASPFGGGMGIQQKTCGAVTGALMAIGICTGRGSDDDVSRKEIAYAKTREFFKRFKEKHGSTDCRKLLLGLSMLDPEDRKKIEEENLFVTRCAVYVADATELTEALTADKDDVSY